MQLICIFCDEFDQNDRVCDSFVNYILKLKGVKENQLNFVFM